MSSHSPSDFKISHRSSVTESSPSGNEFSSVERSEHTNEKRVPLGQSVIIYHE